MLILVLLVLPSWPAKAYVYPDEKPITNAGNGKQQPDISFNHFGDSWLAAWLEHSPINGCSHIRAAAANFEDWGTSEIEIKYSSDSTCDTDGPPKIAEAWNGNYWMVTWATTYTESSTTHNSIIACRLDWDGDWYLTKTGCWVLSSGDANTHANPDIGMDITSGKFLAVWEESVLTGQEIHGRFLDGNGPSGNEFTILSTPVLQPGKYQPAISQLGYNGYLVAAEKRYSSSNIGIEARYISGTGSMSSAFTVVGDSSGLNQAPEVAASSSLSGNQFFTAWHYQVPGTNNSAYNIKGRFLNSSGTISTVQTIEGSSDLAYNPAVGYAASDSSFLVAYGKAPYGQWTGAWDLYATRLKRADSGVITQYEEEPVANSAYDEGSAALSNVARTVDYINSIDLVVTWDRSSSGIPNYILYYKDYSASKPCYYVDITNDPSAGGSVAMYPTTDCGGYYTAGTSVRLTANANPGYIFTGWTGDALSTGNPVWITMDDDKFVTANYARCYTLTLNYNGGLGSAPTASLPNSPGCPTGQYTAGTSLTLTPHPATGYTVGSWSGTDSPSSNHLTMPASDCTVTVTYTQICYTLTRTSSTGGDAPTAAPPNSSGCPDGQYHYGESISLADHPWTGYYLASWDGTDGPSSNHLSMPASSHTVTANYGQACYTLTRTYSGGPGGAPIATPPYSTGCANDQYRYNESISLKPNPGAGYHLESWTGTDSPTSNHLNMPAQDHTVVANYAEGCLLLTLSHTGSGENPSVSPPNSPSCPGGQYNGEAPLELTAHPAEGFTVSGWSGTFNDVSTDLINYAEMPWTDYSISVHYVSQGLPCYSLTLTHSGPGSNPTASPANSPSCPTGQYIAGATLELTAVPDAGSTVDGWAGTINDASKSLTNTATMPDGPHTVSVTYVSGGPACYLLTLTHANSGTDPTVSPPYSPGCSTGQYVAGASLGLTAHPGSGYTVSGWSGTNNDASTSLTNTASMPAGAHTVGVTYTPDSPAAFGKSLPLHNTTGVSLTPTLAWGASAKATNYEYCLDSDVDTDCDTGWQTVGNATSKAISQALNPNTTYSWQVRSWNGPTGPAYANGSLSAFWKFTTADASGKVFLPIMRKPASGPLTTGLYSYLPLSDKNDVLGFAITGNTATVTYAAGRVGNALSIPTDIDNSMVYFGSSINDRDNTYRSVMYQDTTVNVWINIRSFNSLTEGIMDIISGMPGEQEAYGGCVGAINHWALELADIPGCNYGTCPGNSSSAHVLLSVPSWNADGSWDSANSVTLTAMDGLLATDQWYMLTVTHNSTTHTWKVYVNGVLKTSVTKASGIGPGALTRACPYAIGDRPIDSKYGHPFAGLIDEAAFWNRVLATDEISALYNNGAGLSLLP